MILCDASRIYLSLPEYTPFSTTICDPPRIYPFFPEYTPVFNNLPIPPSQDIPPFSTTTCDTPRIYPYLPEYTALFNNYMYNIMRRSQNLPVSPKIYPSFQQLYATLLESTPPSRNIPPPPLSTTICYIPRIYSSVTEYAPFSRTTCICERIFYSLPALKNILGGRGRSWEGRK